MLQFLVTQLEQLATKMTRMVLPLRWIAPVSAILLVLGTLILNSNKLKPPLLVQ